MNKKNTRVTGILILLAASAFAQDSPTQPAKQASDQATAKTPTLEVNLKLIRRAVTSGLITAREGKLAMQFHQLRKQKGAGKLSEQETKAQLKDLGMTWAQGIELMSKLVPATSILANGDFEKGNDVTAEAWSGGASHPPKRSRKEAHDGIFSMHAKLQNVGPRPCEGILRSSARIEGGQTYGMQFWVKPISVGPSYVTQYNLQWLDGEGEPLKGTGFVFFNGQVGKWNKIEAPKLEAPEKAKEVSLLFRFVTGAVKNGHGEMYLDGVTLYPTDAADSPDIKSKVRNSKKASNKQPKT